MRPPARLLFVDDDDTFRSLLGAELEERGFAVAAEGSVAGALARLEREEFDLALVDLRLGDGSGLTVLQQIQSEAPRVEVVMLTGHGSIDSAIEAMRVGAYDYLRKPCPVEELEVALQKALERQALVERNTILRDGYSKLESSEGLVGVSPQFRELLALVERVGATESTVLVLGETGVGKDRVARLVHHASARRKEPFVVVECAALHEDLLHSELFGHEKGAYTGAAQSKHGLFEVADGGTIFLDEIGDVSLTTQVKLLRVLETGTFRRVGGTREIKVDVRIIAATNRDLQDLMAREYFRRDLFYRLSTVRLEVPPLRERPGDPAALVDHFLERFNRRFGRDKRLTPAAQRALEDYHWPGNVRELLHVIEHAMIVSEGSEIDAADLPPEVRMNAARKSGADHRTLRSLAEVEHEHIATVLAAVGGNRSEAARILGISERTLYRKIR